MMKNKIRKIILIICVCVFGYSAYQLGTILYNYYQIDKETTELVETYTQEDKQDNDPLHRSIDFVELLKLNEDVVGWIYVPGTTIDEAVLKGENNDTYLRTDIFRKHNTAGAIFIDEINHGDFLDQNTIIYGHNMFNDTRFTQVKNFMNKDFFDENQYVYLYLPDGSINVYHIYAATIIDAYSDLYYRDIDYGQYTQAMMQDAKQTREVNEEEAPLIMLSTCVKVNDDNRYVVSARLENIVNKHE